LKALLRVSAMILAALAVVALGVFGFHDDATFVPPPEAVVEGFMRALTTHRYAQALSYLDPGLRARGAGALRRREAEIERVCGHVHDVRGEAGNRSGESASAVAVLRTARGDARLRFELLRQQGEWRLASLGE
jgi:hypothetical protein